MHRKEFIKKICQLWVRVGVLLLLVGSKRASAESTTQSSEGNSGQTQKFTRQWIKNLMDNMDAQLDEETRIKLMVACGRSCARERAIDTARECRGDIEKFLVTMKSWIGEENVRKEGNIIFVVYSKCFCPLVQAGPRELSDTYCHCSRGWLKEMFETVLDKSVTVELIQSIKRGDKECRFIICT